MTFLQALRYFLLQALRDMRRSWRVSALAIVVTAASLFLSGLAALLGANIGATLEEWRSQTRVVVMVFPGTAAADLAALEARLEMPFVARAERVTPEEAEARLRRRFPDLEGVVDQIEGSPLPQSFELELHARSASSPEVDHWLAELQELPFVLAVDDDRTWLRELAFAAGLLRVAAALMGGLLLAGAVFIITSVIRLAALVHRQEIKVLRLVGATEFFVKGPFVVEGLLQGLLGSLIALAGLHGGWALVTSRELPELLRTTLLGGFLPASWQLLVLALGTGGGLLGGLLSLRRTEGSLW